MPGLGAPELLLIVVIVVALFGPAVIAFLLGYFVGSSRTKQAPSETPEPTQPQTPGSAPAPPAPDALEEPPADD